MTTPKGPGVEAPATSSPAAETAEAHPLSLLIANAPDWLGQPSFVAAGALSASKRSSLTTDEARAAIDSWLTKPVKE